MAIFTRADFANRGDDCGVFVEDLGRALATWTAMQNRDVVTVAEAAHAFNTLPTVIDEAVNEADWIYIANEREADPCKRRLELDAE